MEEDVPGVIKQPGLMKRLMITGNLTRFILYIVTAVLAIIFIILAILAVFGFIQPAYFESFRIGTWIDYISFAVISGTGILGVYEALRIRRVRKIDDRFPDFVRDLAESRRAGMTFTKAIMYASKGNYGLLTPEIQIIARQISWGSSVDDALLAFSKRVNTKLICRTISLIIEASKSGGNVADVLDAASKDAREIRFIDSERRANMLSYVAVIYVGMFVFLMIVVLLSNSFLPNLTNVNTAGLQDVASGDVGDTITQATITQLFLIAAIIQGLGMGLVAGVFEEGRFASGVKHMFIMVLLTWLIFKILVTGV
jgi:flagellar protein FlaJ